MGKSTLEHDTLADLRQELHSLEQQASRLQATPEERALWQDQVIAHTEAAINTQYERKAFNHQENPAQGLLDLPFCEEGYSIEQVMEVIDQEVDTPGLNTGSPHHYGYVPGGGLYPSALGDYMAAVGNHYASVFFPGPGPVRMENMLIRWVAELMGYPETAAGVHTSGGTLATLNAIVIARENAALRAKDFSKAVIYLGEQTHHCVLNSFHVAGMGESIIRSVPLDESFRTRHALISEMIKADKQAGLIPFMVVGSAGTTDTGAIDDLDAMADIAEQHKLWYHVDAAYGGFFMLAESIAPKLKGIERSDSLVVDPHKAFFLPYGSGLVLVRDRKCMFSANKFSGNYMQDAKEGAEISPNDVSIELSRHFRGFRMWMPLQLMGVGAFRAALEEKAKLSHYFWHKIQTIPGFEVGPFPDISTLIFRYTATEESLNECNARYAQAIQKDGRTFVSTTQIKGVFWIRFTVIIFRAHLAEVDRAIEVFKEILNEQLLGNQ